MKQSNDDKPVAVPPTVEPDLDSRTVFLASVFEDSLRQPLFAKCGKLLWDPQNYPKGRRTIEALCRELIRRSKIFVAILDHREGRELAFDNLATPVTVLEIELMQAIFQQMPVWIFRLPDFDQNPRLLHLVDMAERHGQAVVIHAPDCTVTDQGLLLGKRTLSQVVRVIENGPRQRLSRWFRATQKRLSRFSDLEVEMFAREFEKFNDPFDPGACSALISRAVKQHDHAAQLAMLWAALRQLCAVPYTQVQPIEVVSLWENCLTEWKRSGAWYGMHDGSPLSLLAAVNSLEFIRADHARQAAIKPRVSPPQREYAGWASAIYSMSRRTFLPWHRRRLLNQALAQVKEVLRKKPNDPSGNLLVRGSIYLRLWRFGKAIRDHENAVRTRCLLNANDKQLGEALTELGWTYAHALHFWAAQQVFEEGIKRLQTPDPSNNQDDGFLIRGLFKYGAFMAATMHFPKAIKSMRQACLLANDREARDQVRGVRRLVCSLINRAS